MKHKKTILITGCDSGFGKEAALALAKRKHKVIATVKESKSVEYFSRIRVENNLDITSFVLDVLNQNQRQLILNYDLDVLINNAGIGQSGSLAEIPLARVRENFETNVFATLDLTQLALKKMMKKDSGRIIFISSLAGRVPMKFLGAYNMTKFSLSCASAVLRQELALISKNVHCTVVEPGAYHTGFNQRMLETKDEWLNNNSYFFKILDKIKKEETARFAALELKSNRSIIKKIIKAVEDSKPSPRYSAPWWQNWGVKIARIFS